MVEAEVVEVRQQTDITASGQTREILVPVFTLPAFAGTCQADGIPQSDFSRDLLKARVRSLAGEMLDEGEQVTVSLPST